MIVTHYEYDWHCALEPIETYKVVAPLSDYAVLEPFKLQKYFIGRKYSIPFENIKVYTTAEPAILYHVYGCFKTYSNEEQAKHELNQIRAFYGKINLCIAKCTIPVDSLYIDYDGIFLSDHIIIHKLISPETLFNRTKKKTKYESKS